MKVGRRENIWAQGTWSKKIEILPFKFNTLSVYFCSVQWPPIVNSLEGEALTHPPTPPPFPTTSLTPPEPAVAENPAAAGSGGRGSGARESRGSREGWGARPNLPP